MEHWAALVQERVSAAEEIVTHTSVSNDSRAELSRASLEPLIKR